MIVTPKAKHYFSKYGLISFLLIALMGSSLAQNNREEMGGKKFRVTLLNKWEGDQIFIKVGADYEKLVAHKNICTKPYRYQNDKPVILYVEKILADDTVTYAPLLSMPVPTGMLEPLVALQWDPKLKKGNGKLIEFSPIKFPYGSYQVVNMSKVPLAGYIGKAKKKQFCKANQACIIQPGLKNKDTTPVVFFTKVAGKVQLAFSSMTIHRERKRVIIFMFRNKKYVKRIIFSAGVLEDFNPR